MKKDYRKTYEVYASGELQKRITELQTKVESKTASKEEFDELKRMKKVQENLPRVENIMRFQDELEANLKILKSEYANRGIEKSKEATEKDQVDLDEKLKQKMLEREEIAQKLKQKRKDIKAKKEALEAEGISEEDRQKISEEITDLEKEKSELSKKDTKLAQEIKENNEAFGKKEDRKATISSKIVRTEELKGMTREEIRKKCFEVAGMISKCNMVAGHLLKGESRESLEVRLANWKDAKYTSKTPLPLTRAERLSKSEKVKPEEVKPEEIKPEEVKPEEIEPEEVKPEEIEPEKVKPEEKTTAMVPKSKFLDRHPRIARIVNWFRRTFNDSYDYSREEDADVDPEVAGQVAKTVKDVMEKSKGKPEKPIEKSFKENIKYNPELLKEDILGVAYGDKEEKQKELKAKLEANRKEAIARQNEKYGSDYSKKSGDER